MIDIEYYKDGSNLIGCDEVGRGPLAGPVAAAAVMLTANTDFKFEDFVDYLSNLGITDSKKLTAKKRLIILEKLNISVGSLVSETRYSLCSNKNFSLSFVIAEKPHTYIDETNILFASLKCMEVASLALAPNLESVILIDGNKTFESHDHFEQQTIVKGDSKSLLIGLASIIAKEFRDYKMQIYAKRYPEYGFERHAGYPTRQHREAIEKFGPTPIHRKSFKGVKEFC